MAKHIEYLNLDEQISKLENQKKLVIVENSKEIFKDYLKSYGYNLVVKSLKHPLMYDDNGHYKSEFTSNNLRYLLDIDRNISICFWKYFKSIEMFFNSALVKVLYKLIDNKTKSPYICLLNKLDIDEIFEFLKTENPKPLQKDTAYTSFFEGLIRYYDSSDWLKEKAINNEKIIDKETKKRINNFFIFKKSENDHKWQYLEIFNLSAIWTFSFCVRCFDMLAKKYKNEIIADFFKNFKSQNKNSKLIWEEFSVLLNILSDFRNKLAHNEAVLNFKGNHKNRDLTKIFNYFDIEIIDKNTIYLNQMLSIFEKIIAKHSINKEIDDSIINKLSGRTKRPDLISELLFEIIEDFSKIQLEENTKNTNQYNM